MGGDGTQATLGGYPLVQGQVVGWRLQTGVAPSQRVFLLAPEDAAALLAGPPGGTGPAAPSGPVDLLIAPAGADPLTVRGLYVLGEAPSPDPRHRAVLVSDRRFLWPRTWVLRRYNWRRRTGDVGLRAGTLQTAQFAQDVGYAAFSTHDGSGTFWKANEILQDVLKVVDPNLITVNDTGADARGDLRLEKVYFDDPGDEAIARALAAIPGAACYLDAGSNLVLFDQSNNARTVDVLKSLGDPTTTAGVAALFDTPGLRPAFVDVLFEREIEARVDALESGGSTSTSPHFLTSVADNVIEVTDQELTLADGRVVAMGTYITFVEFFAAMTTAAMLATYPPIAKSRGLRLDATFVQNTWFAGRAHLAFSFGIVGEDPVWLRRLGAIFLHYRQTYRIQRALMDRFLTVEARRVGLVDVPQGISANAQVFADHAVFVGNKTTAYTSQYGGALFVRNVPGWAENIGGVSQVDGLLNVVSTSACAPTPATLSIVDGETGIFRVQFGLGQAAAFGAQVIPCEVARLGGADPSSGDINGIITLERCELAATHKLAVVLTVTPAAPNSKRQLHRVRVLPSDAEKYLGQKIGNASGPTLEIRIPGSLLPARVPWQDGAEFAAQVEKALGMDDPSGKPSDEYVDLPAMNDSDLQALAQAAAAAYWALYLPQYDGAQAGFFNPHIQPAGRALVVEHKLDPRGRASTTVVASVQTQPRDPLSTLPDSVRQTILRFSKVAAR